VRQSASSEAEAARVRAEEAAIVQSVLEGHRDQFRHLVVRYQDSLVGTILRLVRDRDVAEDLAQQSLVDAYDALARFDSRRRFSTWLFRIGINNAKDWLKSHKRGERSLDRNVAAGDAAFAGRMPSPERAASAHELLERLELALSALPVEFREVILLKDIEGMAYSEIHDILGHPITTLKIRAVRGRAALRKLMEESDAPA